jgi:hypothetical protein
MATDTSLGDAHKDVDDAELTAMGKVLAALKDLEPSIQQSVIEWAVRRFKLKSPFANSVQAPPPPAPAAMPDLSEPGKRHKIVEEPEPEHKEGQGEIEGVNVVAQKWVRRSGLSEDQISKLFSLGVDDIDVVAKSVPGKKKIERLKNVLLLQGVAAYLGSGVARVEWTKLKESASHYDADAGGNFPTYLRGFSAEATGSVATGFTLTSRGLNEAKELIKQMTTPASKN